jgi:c-di-GMP-binding flagellar brake protein YcgR
MREKRKLIRFEIPIKATYIIQKEPKLEKTGMTKDISAGGMQLLTSEALPVNGKIDIKLFLPEALNPVHFKGIVAWSKEIGIKKTLSYSAGVEFDKIEEDNKSTFLKFLCELLYEKIGKKKIG